MKADQKKKKDIIVLTYVGAMRREHFSFLTCYTDTGILRDAKTKLFERSRWECDDACRLLSRKRVLDRCRDKKCIPADVQFPTLRLAVFNRLDSRLQAARRENLGR